MLGEVELEPEFPDTVSRTESGVGRMVLRLFPPDDGHHLSILGPVCSRPPANL